MSHLVTPPQSASSNRPFSGSSPDFSDYYTESSPSAGSSFQGQQLLRRLDSFREQIANFDPSSKTAKQLYAQLDSLEAALNAPDTQTREATDLEDSGLFLSEEEEEELKARVESAKLLASQGPVKNPWELFALFKVRRDRERQELRDTIDCYGKLCREFEKRLEEVKRVNELVELQLLASRDEIAHLRTANKTLKSKYQNLREDLQLTGSELVFLKFQVDYIEKVAVDYLPRELHDAAFEGALARWRVDWENVSNRYYSRKYGKKQDSQSTPSASHGHAKSLSEPQITRSDADRSATFPLTQSAVHVIASSEPCALLEPGDMKPPVENTPTKTGMRHPSRWNAFWDALADAAGIIDYEEILQDNE